MTEISFPVTLGYDVCIWVCWYVGSLGYDRGIQQMRNIRNAEQSFKIYRLFITKSRST
jgi:hypothetical protein